mgnify:CR=1 FL=1
MRTNLFKSLLVAVMAVLFGGSSALATVKEVKSWDFTKISYDYSTEKTSQTVKINKADCYYCTGALEGLALQGGKTTWFVRKEGLCQGNGDRNLAILNLKKGDKVIVNTATPLFNVVNGTGDVLVGENCEFIVSNDGTFGFTMTKRGKNTSWDYWLKKITIYRDISDDYCEAPTYSIVGAFGNSRTIKLSCETTDATIYYSETLKETSEEGWEKYSDLISTDKPVIYAFAKAGEAKSEIKTINTTAGTYLTLNAPEINISFKQNGENYIPVYNFSSDQSSITGTPDVTYSYEINSSNGTATSYEATEKGTLKVIVSADGYTSAEKTVVINNLLFNKSYNYDFSTLTTHSETKVSENSTNYNGAGCDAYTLESNEFENITLNGMSQLWAITKGYTVGLMARTGKGSITYTGSFPEGSYFVGDNYASSTNVLSYSQYGVVKELSVYIPLVTETVSVSAVGYATYATNYNVKVPEDENVKVMTVTVNEGNSTITLHEVAAGTVIPANTGILVKAAQGDYNFAVTSEADDELPSNNLVAAKEAVTSNDAKYKYFALTKLSDGKVGFAVVKEGVNIPAGKAYLKVIKSTAAKFFGLDGEATGINSVKTAKADGAYYTLEGVKTTKPVKGIYIHNGKKIVVK